MSRASEISRPFRRNTVIGVTGAGTPAGDAVIAGLRDGGFDGGIVALGYDPEAMERVAAGAHALLARPERGWETFRSRLLYARHRFGMDALIAADPAHLPLLVRFRENLADAGLRTVLPTREQYALRDRERLAALARRIDARTPATRRIGTHADLFRHWSEFAKPALLASPSGVARRVDRFDEAAFLLEEIGHEHGLPALLRAAPAGAPVYASAFGDGEGRFTTTGLRQNPDVAPVTDDVRDEIAYVVENFVHATRWRGAFELVFETDRNRVTLAELRPHWHETPDAELVMAMAERLSGAGDFSEKRTETRLLAV